MEKNTNGSLKIERKKVDQTISFKSFMSEHGQKIKNEILDEKTTNLISEGFIRHWGEPKKKKRFWFF